MCKKTPQDTPELEQFFVLTSGNLNYINYIAFLQQKNDVLERWFRKIITFDLAESMTP